MANPSSPPPAYSYGEKLYAQAADSGKVPTKTFHFSSSSSKSLNEPNRKHVQKETAITIDKKEKDAVDEWIVKVQKKYSSLIVISLCVVGLLFIIMMQTRAIHQLDRKVRKQMEEIKCKDAEIARWMQKYDEKDREIKLRSYVSTFLAKRRSETIQKNEEELAVLKDRLQEYEKNDALKNAETQGTTSEERVVKINAVGSDGFFGFTLKKGTIVEVEEGWPAKAAGMRLGDVIVTIDGVSFFESSDDVVVGLFEKARERGSVTLVLRYNHERMKEIRNP